ncbi:hypothetical protein [Caulobacter sp.]|uniref:hypothetical protein n=1 Tax=Caulobacter sp. TaxID=78 RepID=UPI002B4803FA|nr:hypothetical protein [Caulobacter sp.]HJV43582.1 hypothetical protein [Caulobacter sp.]
MATAPKPRSNPALRFAAVRRIHSYLALLIAPSVMFFALTGAVQLYELHESHGAYVAPAVIEKLGMVHKNQVYKARGRKPGPPAAEAAQKPATATPATAAPQAAAKAPDAEPAVKPAIPLLKAVFLLVSIALVATTALGVWMAIAYGREKKLSWILLAVGAVIPLVLTALSA